MEQQRECKTYQYQLMPTPARRLALALVLWRCRMLSNTALDERKAAWERRKAAWERRKAAWERRRVSVGEFQQKAELPALKADVPAYAAVNAPVLPEVILRVERPCQAFFRRRKNGEQPGYPRFPGRTRYHSFTYPQAGGGVTLDGGVLSLSQIGRIPIRLHRPLEGTPKPVTISREAAGWYAGIACAAVPTQPLPLTGQETGIDGGLKVVLVTADEESVENPRQYRTAEKHLKQAQRRASRRKKGANAARRPSPCGSGSTSRCSANGGTSSTRRP